MLFSGRVKARSRPKQGRRGRVQAAGIRDSRGGKGALVFLLRTQSSYFRVNRVTFDDREQQTLGFQCAGGLVGGAGSVQGKARFWMPLRRVAVVRKRVTCSSAFFALFPRLFPSGVHAMPRIVQPIMTQMADTKNPSGKELCRRSEIAHRNGP